MDRVPLTGAPHQIIDTVLGGQAVTLDLSWAPLTETWRLSVSFSDGQSITAGRQVTENELLIGPTGAIAGFVGNLIALGSLDRDAWHAGPAALYYLLPEEVPAGRFR